MNIKTESIQIPLEGGGAMGGYLARPDDGEARSAILVFMEIFGINAHIRDVAQRLAREGYVALAPDYFHRTGPGGAESTIGRTQRIKGRILCLFGEKRTATSPRIRSKPLWPR